MSKQTTFATPHVLTLDSEQEFITRAHVISKNRYFDGVDYLYFETENPEHPQGARHYHTWNIGSPNTLYAWVIPQANVKEIVKQSRR